MNPGFYTALGTPLDEFGHVIPASLIKHVQDQVATGASGLLAMGSMGNQSSVRQSEYAKIAATAVEAAGGSCPIFVGVMDNSIDRVMDRIEALRGLNIDGVVATAPFYYTTTQEEILTFFTEVSKRSPKPVYIYDLPGVTKVKISEDTVRALMSLDNIRGIKTGDLATARVLSRCPEKRDDFHIFFSGLDVFDVAYQYGLTMNLDGMFSCTPLMSRSMYQSLSKGDYEEAGKHLDDIVALRNAFIKVGVFRGFSYAMNLLGYEGSFAPDYAPVSSNINFETIRELMAARELV